MYISEDEAKKKWCPMVSFNIGPNDAVWQNTAYTNRADKLEPIACLCIASNCMMWHDINNQGYCGLAGRPWTDERRAKVSNALRGKPLTEERKRNISIAKLRQSKLRREANERLISVA